MWIYIIGGRLISRISLVICWVTDSYFWQAIVMEIKLVVANDIKGSCFCFGTLSNSI